MAARRPRWLDCGQDGWESGQDGYTMAKIAAWRPRWLHGDHDGWDNGKDGYTMAKIAVWRPRSLHGDRDGWENGQDGGSATKIAARAVKMTGQRSSWPRGGLSGEQQLLFHDVNSALASTSTQRNDPLGKSAFQAFSYASSTLRVGGSVVGDVELTN